MTTTQLNPETGIKTQVDWEFIEVCERHDSNWCEWLIEGTGKDGSLWTGTTQTDGTYPQFENPIENVYLNN